MRISDPYVVHAVRRERTTAAMAIVFYMAVAMLCLTVESPTPAAFGLAWAVISSAWRYGRLTEMIDDNDRRTRHLN